MAGNLPSSFPPSLQAFISNLRLGVDIVGTPQLGRGCHSYPISESTQPPSRERGPERKDFVALASGAPNIGGKREHTGPPSA